MVLSYLGNPLTQEYILKGTTYQVFERGQLAWSKDKGVWLVPLGEVLAQQHQISTAPVAQGNLPAYSEELFVAPKQQKKGNGERWIEVNLTTQYLIAWEGDVSIAETYVSTGRPGFDTPPGTYHILVKLESQTMEGVIGGEYYNVPDVPWVQYFTNYGHALHGTYWHNNFGAIMSHGCVNLPMDFAEWLYGWTSIGTRVEIHYLVAISSTPEPPAHHLIGRGFACTGARCAQTATTVHRYPLENDFVLGQDADLHALPVRDFSPRAAGPDRPLDLSDWSVSSDCSPCRPRVVEPAGGRDDFRIAAQADAQPLRRRSSRIRRWSRSPGRTVRGSTPVMPRSISTMPRARQ